MVFHRLRGSSESIGNGSGRLGNMDRGSPLHLRMLRVPRWCNAVTGVLVAGTLVAVYLLLELHSLQGLIETQQRDLLERLGQLKTGLSGQRISADTKAVEGGQVSHDVYISNHRPPSTMWIMSKSFHHLNHVITVFERSGFQIIRQASHKFDVIWSYDYPFNSGWRSYIMKMKAPQKINHFPGSGYITNKMSLSTSKIKYLPKAYRIPEDVAALKSYASDNPDTMYVMKSNDHRGIKIKKLSDMDLSEKGRLNFVQEFVSKPLLINNRKFDIGIYVVITSINPLRVYVYDEEVLLRFCAVDYQPLDVTNVEKYVIGDRYTPTREIPSLKNSIVDRQYSMKQTLSVYLKSKGFDPDKLWSQIRSSIREVTLAKEKDLKAAMATYPDPAIFFEMVRFDFVVDDELNLWLMEVNMSPNLASSVHPENAIMYEQVIFNTLALVGAVHYTGGSLTKLTQEERAMLVRSSDVIVPVDECHKEMCSHCSSEICALCQQCMSDQQLGILEQAFSEHVHRRNFARVFPVPENSKHELGAKQDGLSTSNKVMQMWYRAKCSHSPAWCV